MFELVYVIHRTLLELVKDREIKKNDLGHCYADIFRKRYQLEDWSGSLISVLRPVTTPTATSSGRQLSAADGHWDSKGLSFKVNKTMFSLYYLFSFAPLGG